MELSDFLHAVRKGWWLLLVGVLLGLAVAAGVLWATPPQYSSSTRLWVHAAATDEPGIYDGNQLSQQRMASYAELLTGETLAARVVGDLGLERSPEQLAQQIHVAVVPETVVLDVTVHDRSARGARDIAADLAQQFVAQVDQLETSSGAATSPVQITVAQPARLMPDPVSPQPGRALGLGAAFGLLAGLGVLLVRHRLNTTVQTRDDVAGATGSALVGAVPADPRLPGRDLAVVDDEQPVSAEAFRAVAAGLQFLHGEGRMEVVAVTSALPGEGRTTLALNVALALAESGARVVLVEADARAPRMSQDLGLAGGPGLAEVLAGTVEWRELTPLPGSCAVTVLTAGRAAVRPGALGSPRMAALLESLRETHDVVVLDTAPLLEAVDAALVAALADGCLLVARHGVTRREQLAEAARILHRVDVPVLGVVLNRVPRKDAVRAGFAFSAPTRPARRRPDTPREESPGRGAHRPAADQPPVPTARAAGREELATERLPAAAAAPTAGGRPDGDPDQLPGDRSDGRSR